ncbi:phospholipid-translocating p-type flippase family protein, putative [Ichthyophthirius multifiliis]|uniref:Phospholipid-transporting ATPase n=1 Tax=Ichthyophthirius multifiliis TaxID=5932 RepID=G0R208_ICHMU|nr:phospholipid-translocating p-type flippase family protein, putative [Ichthyophthirius multifiliis]EGR28497.1 phospholipid-translocating p-type flippase family protein, putative [Ichthyophthirius multifiliis]|eukprot:XP_004029733.1 phospholipid-translocating p-type flippase family protein, putative [Ichthyophthirius multifiliis]
MGIFSRRLINYNQDRQFKAFVQENKEEKSYPSNFIKTSRYNLIDFLPLSLLIQFQRYANIYFLITAILQSIPEISPLSPFVAIAPLVFVLAISMIREGYEDYQRHVSDNEQNYQQKTTQIIVQNRSEIQLPYARINVGDILKITKDTSFPADMLVLGSELGGPCYIETGALDGEKNLKPRCALANTARFFDTKSGFFDTNNSFHLEVQAKAPDQNPNRFEGAIKFYLKNESETEDKFVPSNAKQLLPRGAFLRNTEYIYGVVVYTGMDTKIMRNSESAKAKCSDMEKKMNTFILGILIFQLTCAFVMSSCHFVWLRTNKNIYPYLNLTENNVTPALSALFVFFSYFILFNTMIPISLVVSLEMVKVAQSYFITKDELMYSPHNDKMPKVLTSSINEELGQVEYIFSDKTGTLTQNEMQFKYCVIGNTLYGDKVPMKKAQNKTVPIKNQPLSIHEQKALISEFTFEDYILSNILTQEADIKDNFNLNYVIKSKDGKSSYTLKNQYELSCEYFKALGIAHECIVQKNKDPLDTKMYYQGPSPDEITLVDCAYNMGFTFTGNTTDGVLMKINEKGGIQKQYEFKRYNIFEFSSDRKRMTIIIEDNGIIKMYIKGADSIVIKRLVGFEENKPILDNKQQPFLENAIKKLTEFSSVGLRTLLIGIKIMSRQELDAFLKEYQLLSDSKDRDTEMAKLADKYEQDFYLLGATAVEDKLQDQVPEVINDMLRANIKVWMLTGDKLETAENIARSCKLILNDFECLTISATDEKIIRKELMEIQWRRFKYCKENKIRKCFLIEGDALTKVFDERNPDLKKRFVQITKECESVVCCRVSPTQKAQVVRSIKQQLGKVTLAIGDGANDVNMIQEAHIGCGLYGNEGMRAVQSSDFALGQFKCLWRLLLVHGRWSYIRISEMIIYFFYKNMIFTIPQFFFAFYCGFSGQTIFDDIYISLYNLVFTALPLIIRAIFDQDINYNYYDLPKEVKQSLIKDDRKKKFKKFWKVEKNI